ncbi:MAG: LysR family transcriptional regulator [Candidatus Riflebacteria bacterium]|nr:LysR family transcriptional regulator [Candidatus Riflebacteria bacterium]
MLPDFNRLKVFYSVFREGSTTGAARELHLTQSGVSQHLRKLESELKRQLFTRVNRRLVPTSAARDLYSIVSGFIGELENGVARIRKPIETPSGLLRIGAPAEFGKSSIPRIFASFHKRFPEVSLHLELGGPNHLFSLLGDGSLDFAYIDILPIFIDKPGGDSSYIIEPVFREEFILMCSKKFYECHISDHSLDCLRRQPFIAYKSNPALFNSWFKLHFDSVPTDLNIVFSVDSAQAIISAIEEDLGLGIVVSHLLFRQLSCNSIVSITVSGKKLENTIAYVRLKNRSWTITERAFQKHFQRELRRLPFSLTPLIPASRSHRIC